ncbi:MAG: PKD domain-containing protein, partial [Chloroflexi bacterium]|nr:PKD domain-containing protein [Chloroflexota bacterium]
MSEIHFHVVGSAGNTSDITLSSGVLSANTATEIPATWVGDSVHVNTTLDAEFSASPLEGVAGVTGFTFTDATTGCTPPYTYEWDFDNDGAVDSTAASPTHIYANAGTYT